METIRDNEEEKKSCEGINIVFIGHPIRVKQKLKIGNEVYNISFDGFKDTKHNEDPFIWNDNFLYSFCHANHALSADIRQKIKKEEVYLVFVSKTGRNSKIVEIDTIIKAEEIYEWPNKNERFKESLCSKIFNGKVIAHHLPKFLEGGGISEHNNKNLYTCVGDSDGSFLPMKKDGDIFIPFRFNESVSKNLLELIKVTDNDMYYVAKSTSPRLITENKENTFNKVYEVVKKLIEEENSSRGNPKEDQRFLKSYQIRNLDKKNLFVIGNGFDIAHNIESQYSKFMDFVFKLSNLDELDRNKIIEDEIEAFEIPSSVLNHDGEEIYNTAELAAFYHSVINTISFKNYDPEWKDFEKNLGELNILSFTSTEFVDKHGDIEPFRIASDVEEIVHNLKSAYQTATFKLFSEWIRSLDTSRIVATKKTIQKHIRDSYFLTFNYTNVLEDVYNVENYQVCHIHGSINENKFIVGHGKDEKLKNYEQNPFSVNDFIIEIVNVMKKDTSKHYVENLTFFENLKDIENIYFIGFNLSDENSVDSLYFKKLFKELKCFNVYFDSYHQDEIDKFKQTLETWGGQYNNSYVINTERDKVVEP